MKVFAIPRNYGNDKILRAEDCVPYVKSGRVFLNTGINKISNTTKEAREFPNGKFDDDIDNLMNGIEVAFINKMTGSNRLKEAMAA